MREMRLLGDSLRAAARLRPEHAAVVAGGERYTYAELYERSLRLAWMLESRGVARGDRVAVFMENGFETAAAIFGTLLAGGVFMVINAQTKTDKLRFVLEDSGAKVLLADEHLHPSFAPAAEGLDLHVITAPLVVPAGPDGEIETGVIPLDLASLIYTSGSTGQPKGVMMTHQAMVFTTGSLIEYLRLSPDHRILAVLPLSFDYGLYQLLMAVRLQATLVLERSFTYPGEIVRRIREEEVTVLPGVPTIFQMLIGLADKKPFVLPSVERLTNTAAALPTWIGPRLRNIFPNALLYRMYGLTECKRVSYLEPELADVHPRSVGRAIPGTEVLVLSPDGERVAPGEVGILHVRGPHVMAGYWNQPEKTAEMLRPGPLPGERMLCTHDLFTVDEQGLLYFVGRSDDIIKTRGEKVSPVEVENVLLSLPGVREVAVVGVEDELLGQRIRAYVAADVPLTEVEVKRHCMAHLEPFMVPAEVIFLESLPKTTSGKIRKHGLTTTSA